VKIPFRVVVRNLVRHPVRSLFTAGSMTVAVFLMVFLRTVVASLDAGVDQSQSNRLIVQSAVSLFVNLPSTYAPKIQSVPGVVETNKWVWFGAYYQDPSNFFAQFAVDEETLLDVYPEIAIVDGSHDEFLAQKTNCLVGKALADLFEWKVGDTIPLISQIFPKSSGDAWEFTIAGIYEPSRATVDPRTLFFHFDYLDETLEAGGAMGQRGTSTYTLLLQPGANPTQVMADVDALYENGPQRVQTTTESEFNRQFVSMYGNVPMFVNSIGGGVLLAVLLACVNSMLMAARQQTRDVGVMKAMGFSDAVMAGTMLSQSLVICIGGGLVGILLAVGLVSAMGPMMGSFLPGFGVHPSALTFGVILSVAVGLLAGVLPAIRSNRLRPVEALRSLE